MDLISDWRGASIQVARSAGGVLVTTQPASNLVHTRDCSWPAPEIIQKLTQSVRFRGATPEDDAAAKSGLGYYCDLQSLNSEDAIAWSVFGTLAYLPGEERTRVASALLDRIGVERGFGVAHCWLWRRIPHPEKPSSSGGPEIDFGIMRGSTLVIGEAKWNSSLGVGQGINRDRSQEELRSAYCCGLARKFFPQVRNYVLLGVGRTASVFRPASQVDDSGPKVVNLAWEDVIACHEEPLREELEAYLQWKNRFASPAPEATVRARQRDLLSPPRPLPAA